MATRQHKSGCLEVRSRRANAKRCRKWATKVFLHHMNIYILMFGYFFIFCPFLCVVPVQQSVCCAAAPRHAPDYVAAALRQRALWRQPPAPAHRHESEDWYEHIHSRTDNSCLIHEKFPCWSTSSPFCDSSSTPCINLLMPLSGTQKLSGLPNLLCVMTKFMSSSPL